MRIFFNLLWSHVAQWLLMQLFVIQSLPSPPVSLRGGLYLSWHVPGCVGGGSDSLSRCELPLSTATCQTKAKQLISSCRRELWWQYCKHITINRCTGPGPSHKDNELLLPHYEHSCFHQRRGFQMFITHSEVVARLTLLFVFCIIKAMNGHQSEPDEMWYGDAEAVSFSKCSVCACV